MRAWHWQWWHGRWWKTHWQDALFGVLPALLLLVIGQVDALWVNLATPVGSAPSTTAAVPAAIACVALVLRRRRPMTTLVVILLALIVPSLLTPTSLVYWGEFVPWLLAIYSSARHQRRLQSVLGLGVSAVGMLILAVIYPGMRDPADLLYNSALLAAAWLLGLFTRSWTDYRDRIARSDAERALAEERAGRAERVRIARELHDVLAHTITVIVMQAGGARLASASDPTIASSTLEQIEALGRSSLIELRALLPLLRDGNDELPTAPQPTLAGVDAMCARMRRLGLPVTLQMDADAQSVPLGLQLTAYRAIQEGLTNVLKHAGRVETTVRIRCTTSPALLMVEVTSRLPVDTPQLPGAGRGLAGIEERVQLAGGVFSAGRDGEAAFVLRVELPLRRELA